MRPIVVAVIGALVPFPGFFGYPGSFFIGGLIIALAAFWLLPIRLELHPDHITYRSVFRFIELRLDELEFFYIHVGDFILFRRCSFQLWDSQRRKISLGGRMRNPAQLEGALIKYTCQPLLRKYLQRFDAGQELDFGYVRLSRAKGLQVRNLRHKKVVMLTSDSIPLDQIGGWEIRSGRFYVGRIGEKPVRGPFVHEIPNVFVLRGVLETVCGKGKGAAK